MVTVNAQLQATKEQIDLAPLSASDEKLRMSLLGQQYSANWKYLMVAAGRAYTISVPEHATGGGGLTLATGNAGVDLDQPELVVPCGEGYRIIPMDLEIDGIVDLDAYDDTLNLYFFVDRTQTQSGVTGTNVTPQNCLDGGPSYPGGQVVSIVSSDLTDPVHSQILTARYFELTQVAAETAGNGIPTFYHRKVWQEPENHLGPCSIIGIVAATVAPTFMLNFKVGIVPASWFPVD